MQHTCWDIWEESYNFLCDIYPLNETAFKFKDYHIRGLNKIQLLLIKGKRKIYGGAVICVSKNLDMEKTLLLLEIYTLSQQTMRQCKKSKLEKVSFRS